MKTICAWCDKIMGDDGNDDGLESHGMCRDCWIEICARHGLDPDEED